MGFIREFRNRLKDIRLPSHFSMLLWMLALFLALRSLGFGQDIESLTKELDKRRKELASVREQIKKKSSAAESLKKKERELQWEVASLQRKIYVAKQEIELKKEELIRTSQKKEDVGKRLEQEKRRSAELREILKGRLRAIYKLGKTDYISALLGQEGFGTPLARGMFLERIAMKDGELLSISEGRKKEFAAQKAELEAQIAELSKEKQIAERRKASLENKYQGSIRMLSSVSKRKAQYEKELTYLRDYYNRLQALVNYLQAQAKKRQEQISAAQMEEARRRAEEFLGSKGDLPWPARGEVVSFFGRQTDPRYGANFVNPGIEIKVEPGTPVKAVSDGIVLHAMPLRGYGKVVLIDHGNVFTTVYGHLEEIAVSAGNRVRQGQVIGKAGSETLFFGIRKENRWVNPLEYLSK